MSAVERWAESEQSGAVTVVAAKLTPGAAQPGQLSTGSLTLDTNSTISPRLEQFDQSDSITLNVTGTVTLAGNCQAIQLVASPSFTGSGALTLINNDGVDADLRSIAEFHGRPDCERERRHVEIFLRRRKRQ